jgi:hypothetical protein
VFRVTREWKSMLEKIRLDVDRVFSRLGLRPKPHGFRLRAGRRFSSFSGPHLGSRPKILGAALEPCLGLSAGIGSISGLIVPQKRAGLVSGSEMGYGCDLSTQMDATPLVTSKADAVLNSDLGLTFAEVTATMMDISDSPVAILLILERASNSRSPADSVFEVLVASAGFGEASGKADRESFLAKDLLRLGFLGSSTVSSPSVLGAKEATSPQQLGSSPFLTAGSGVSSSGVVEMGSRLSLSHSCMTDNGTPIYSSVSKSQKGYS